MRKWLVQLKNKIKDKDKKFIGVVGIGIVSTAILLCSIKFLADNVFAETSYKYAVYCYDKKDIGGSTIDGVPYSDSVEGVRGGGKPSDKFIDFIPKDIEGYKILYVKFNGSILSTMTQDRKYSGRKYWKIPWEKCKTEGSYNGGRVEAIYQKDFKNCTIEYRNIIHQPNGAVLDYSGGSQTKPTGFPLEIEKSKLGSDAKAYIFMYASTDKAGHNKINLPYHCKATGSSMKFYFHYKPVPKVVNKVHVSVTDNYIQANGVCDRMPDGHDYFNRFEMADIVVQGSRRITVASPWSKNKGIPLKKGYKFVVAVIDDSESQGNPDKAWAIWKQGKLRGYRSLEFSYDLMATPTNQYVHFYYTNDPKETGDSPKPKPTPEGEPDIPVKENEVGKIVFTPNETRWDNHIRKSNGVGSYPVETKYVGDNPVIRTGKAVFEYEEEVCGKDSCTTVIRHYTKSFPVYFDIDHIDVTRDDHRTIQGTIGMSYIDHEGVSLHLHGEGFYKKPRYTKPQPDSRGGHIVDLKIPPEPKHPVGDSGEYKLDFTDPTAEFNVKPQIFCESNGARRGMSNESTIKTGGIDQAYYGIVTVKDNLSGVKQVDYQWTFGNKPDPSKWRNIYKVGYTTPDRSSETHKFEIEKPVGDNMYLHVKVSDETNDHDEKNIEGEKCNVKIFTWGQYDDPIKLKNFRVTDIKDPAWNKIFWKDDELTKPTGKEYKCDSLPITGSSNSIFHNAYPKKGYAYYFDVTTEYMYRDYDKIVITPKFYYYDGNKRQEVEGYYNLNNNPFTKIGSKEDTTHIHFDTINCTKNGIIDL